MVETVTKVYDGETSRNWSPDPDINVLFLRHVRNHCYDVLKYRGYLFLNDVLDELGIPRTSRGQLIGWLNTETGEFWTYEYREEEGAAHPIEITFLTQGEIYDKIENLGG